MLARPLHAYSASWINQVERFLALLTDGAIRRSAHRSAAELKAAIRGYIDVHNANPKPFIRTKSAEDILGVVQRFHQRTMTAQAKCLEMSELGQ